MALSSYGIQLQERNCLPFLDTKLGFASTFAGRAKIWNVSTGQEILDLNAHEPFVATGVAFSPDGSRLATSSTDKTAKVWDVKTGEPVFLLEGHTEPIPDIAYSPDGSKIVTGSQDTTAKIWDAQTGKALLTLSGHSAEIQSVAFNVDGKLIATGSGDNTAKLWDTQTGQEIFSLPGSSGGVGGVAFNPSKEEDQLAVAGLDGIVRIFLLNVEDLLALAPSRVTRSLTTAECQKYLHVEQCPPEP
jgi:WD40 repeat protein